mmetsp:Transcript_29001/g.43767  ORF Transcript_29001/g.43767 Transcript_29001/m.43767 type:complete len:175 (-) Transcript_29001:2586-3110(-)
MKFMWLCVNVPLPKRDLSNWWCDDMAHWSNYFPTTTPFSSLFPSFFFLVFSLLACIYIYINQGGHKSTVVTLSFSSDNKYLASSGKDRRLCIWQRHQKEAASPLSGGDDTQSLYKLAAAVDSAHKRIVWSVDFCPLDPTLLASGARDGAVRVWKIVSQEKEEEDDEVEVKEVCR